MNKRINILLVADACLKSNHLCILLISVFNGRSFDPFWLIEKTIALSWRLVWLFYCHGYHCFSIFLVCMSVCMECTESQLKGMFGSTVRGIIITQYQFKFVCCNYFIRAFSATKQACQDLIRNNKRTKERAIYNNPHNIFSSWSYN